MTEVNNLTALRGTNPSLSPVYVKGHANPGDGGGGIFYWKTSAAFATGAYSNENYGTIIKSTYLGAPSGSWAREYDGYIDTRFFGVFGGGGDSTTEIQRAIDFAELNSGSNPSMQSSTVYVPSGVYVISTLTLKSNISFIGDNRSTPFFNAKSGGLPGEYMFEIEDGPVSIEVKNLFLNGNGTDRGCFLLEAKLDSTGTHGGIWNSVFKNLKISNFKGIGMHFKGGIRGDGSPQADALAFKLPNIHNIIENVTISRGSSANQALYLSGQNAQYTFVTCTFNGTASEDGNEVYTFATGHNVTLESDKDHTCATIQFLNCSNQNSDYGYYIKNGENILISNNWFENIGVSVTAIAENTDFTRPSKGIVVDDCRFANAAGFGGLDAPTNIKNGQNVSVVDSYVQVSNSFATAGGPAPSASASFLSASNSNAGGVKLSNNTFGGSAPSKSFGVVEVVNIDTSNNSITTFAHNSVFVNFVAFQVVDTIISELGAAETLTIRANGGPVTFTRNDNIWFSTTNPSTNLVLLNGEIATFTRIDKAQGGNQSFFQLTSVVHAF